MAGVVVVGIVGNSSDDQSEAILLNTLLDREWFEPHSKESPFTIEGSVSSESSQMSIVTDVFERTIYIRVPSPSDPCELEMFAEQLELCRDDTTFHAFLMSREADHVRNLLFTFFSCHLIMIMSPRSHLDLQLLRTLKILHSTKRRIKSSVLRSFLPVNPDCPPAAAFFFHYPNFPPSRRDGHSDSTDPSLVRRFGTRLGAQCEALLGRAAVATEGKDFASSSTALLCLPERFVFVLPEKVASARASLMKFGAGFNDNGEGRGDGGFRRAREQLIRCIRHERARRSSFAALPTVEEWRGAAEQLFGVIFSEKINVTAITEQNTDDSNSSSDPLRVGNLLSRLDADSAFSAALCAGALPTARMAYSRDLTPMYTPKTHREHLAKALATYRRLASGPSAERFEQTLRTELELQYTAERQLCDAVSLTGAPCVLRRHEVAPETGQSRDEALDLSSASEAAPHTSGLRANH
eukprot:730702_1